MADTDQVAQAFLLVKKRWRPGACCCWCCWWWCPRAPPPQGVVTGRSVWTNTAAPPSSPRRLNGRIWSGAPRRGRGSCPACKLAGELAWTTHLSCRCGEGKQVCCPCPQSRCVPIASCQAVQEDYRAIKSNNAERKEAAIARLKSLVCDRQRKAICCPMDASSSPSFLPKQEDGCGTSGNAQFIVGGKTTQPGEFPWAALIGNYRETSRKINRIVHRWQYDLIPAVVGRMRRGGHVGESSSTSGMC